MTSLLVSYAYFMQVIEQKNLPMRATPTTPPITPPAIAPVLVESLSETAAEVTSSQLLSIITSCTYFLPIGHT